MLTSSWSVESIYKFSLYTVVPVSCHNSFWHLLTERRIFARTNFFGLN